MSPRAAAPRVSSKSAWAVWYLCLAGLAATLLLVLLNARILETGQFVTYDVLTLVALVFATAGALIVSRAEGNPIGWVLIGMGLSLVLGGFGEQYLLRSYVSAPGSLPFPAWVGGLTAWTPLAAIALLPVLFLLFPTGRPASKRWGWVLELSVVVFAVSVLATVVHPGQEDGLTNAMKDRGFHIQSPLGIEGARSFLGLVLGAAGLVGVLLAVLGVASLVVRLRRAGAEERQQIKWLAVVGICMLAVFLLMLTSPLYGAQSSLAGDVLWFVMAGLIFLGIPAAVTIAVLKYRLYDIDLVINRTLVYGLLSGALAAIYGALVLGLGLIARSAGGSEKSPLVVAASTLIAAALFRPLRHRVQSFIDRRFYRRRYDAQRTLETFAGRLRDEVDLDALNADLVRAVVDTVQPSRASVWIREAGR